VKNLTSRSLNCTIYHVELDIILAMLMKIYFFRDLTPCTSVCRYRRFWRSS